MLVEYVLSCSFSHIAHINPGNTVVLRAIEALHSNAQQHPSEWDELRRTYPFFGWPTLQHDFVLCILIRFAPEPLLHSYLGSAQLKLKDGTNPLIYAVHSGEIECARIFLLRGVKLNCRGWDVHRQGQFLPLEVAVYCERSDMINLFLAEGSPVPHELFVRALRWDPGTSIHAPIMSRLLQTDEFAEWAADVQDQGLLLRALDLPQHVTFRHSEQDTRIVIKRRLVQLGCGPSTRYNETSLRDAVSAGYISTVEHMLSLNLLLPPDIILDASRSRTSNTEMIHLCLSRGSDVHVVSSTEDTALHLALTALAREDDCSENVQVLIYAGCNPSTSNLAGETPLHLAVRNGYTSIAEYLLPLYIEQLPPDILLATSNLHTRRSVIEHLRSKGADVHAIAANGDTLLHRVLGSLWTDSEDCLACAKILISAGCNHCLPNACGTTPLHVAAKNGHLSVVQYLHGILRSPLPPDILLVASGKSHFPECQRVLPVIKFLISKGADIHVTRPNGDTVLHLAMMVEQESECLKVTKTLVSAGCEPRAFNLAGKTPFHIAAKQGYLSVMKYLLLLGILVPSDVMATQLESPWHGHLTIPFLLDRGGDIHTAAKNGGTLLHLAAKLNPEEDALELTRYLVHAGYMPCVPNSLQETPLHVAARSGFISVIKYLLSLNIPLPPDILLAASTGYSAKARVIHYLVKEGASVSVATTNGDTPLHLVLSEGEEDDRLECVKILIDAGCNPCAPKLAGKTPLHNAAMRGFCTVLEYLLSRGDPLPGDILLSSTATTMRLLLEKGLDLCSVAADGLTELMHRALRVDEHWPHDAVELARILICHGASWDPSLKDSAGETAFHAAASNRNIEALKFLLSQNMPLPLDVLLAAVSSKWYVGHAVALTRFLVREGASVNVAASNGDTPLHLAIASNFTLDEYYNDQLHSWELVEILLECGADPSARNMDGQTPLDLAREKGHPFEQNFLRLVGNSVSVPSRNL